MAIAIFITVQIAVDREADILVPVLVAEEEVSHSSPKQHSNLPVSVVQLGTVDNQSPKSRREPSLTQFAARVHVGLLFKTFFELLDNGPLFTSSFNIRR